MINILSSRAYLEAYEEDRGEGERDIRHYAPAFGLDAGRLCQREGVVSKAD